MLISLLMNMKQKDRITMVVDLHINRKMQLKKAGMANQDSMVR